MAAAFVALLAATPLVAAGAARRQASIGDVSIGDIATDILGDLASLTDIAIPTGTAALSDFPTDFPSSLLGDVGALTKCLPPSSLTLPTGVPTLGSNALRYFVTATDPCAVLGSGAPATLSAEFASYTSALNDWASKNSAALSSYEQAASSYYDSIKTESACAPYIGSATQLATSGALCSQVASSVSRSVSASGSAGTSASTGSASAGAANTSRASGTGTGTGTGATLAPHNAVLMAGASIAITSFIGMILL